MTPLDIETKEFKKAIIGGYNTDHVDNYMGRLTREFENIQREKIELEHKVDRLNDKLDHYKSMEKTLQDTMILAEQTARNAEYEANKKAEQLLLDSTFQSDQMVESAREEVYTIKQNIDGLQKQYKTARVQIKQLLQNQIEILDTQDNSVNQLTAITANMSDAFEPQNAIASNDMASALEPLEPLENFQTSEAEEMEEEEQYEYEDLDALDTEEEEQYEYEDLDALDTLDTLGSLDTLDNLGREGKTEELHGLDAIEEMNKKMAMEMETNDTYGTMETLSTMDQMNMEEEEETVGTMETTSTMSTMSSPDDILDTSAPLSPSGEDYYSNDTFYTEEDEDDEEEETYYSNNYYAEDEEEGEEVYYSNKDYYEEDEEEEEETPAQTQNEDFYTKEYQIINEEDVI